MKKLVLWGLFMACFLLVCVPGLVLSLGYETLDNGSVLHIWNDIDDYYFNKTNGVQFTNHYDDYWTKNVFCIGYKSGSEWVIISCTDELEGWNQDIEQTEDYVFAYTWKDVNLLDYDMRLGIGYKVYEGKWEMEVIPYIKNRDEDDILAQVGFMWRIEDIRVNMTYEDNELLINRTYHSLDDNLSLTYTNLSFDYWDNVSNTTQTVYTPEYRIINDQEFLRVGWDHNLDYQVRVVSEPDEYNAPISLGIRAGQFLSGEEKNTSLWWIDALDTDLRAYWSMDDDDTDDISCEDLVGTNNGTIMGDVETGKTGKLSETYYFDGDNDYIVVPDNSELDLGTNDFSIAFWMNLTDNGYTNTGLVDKRQTGPTYTGYCLYYQTGTYEGFRTQVNGNTVSDVGDAAKAPADVYGTGWHHVVWVQDRDNAGNSHIYFDGAALDASGRDHTGQQGSIDSTNSLKIGEDEAGVSDLEGSIEEIGIWDRVLSSDEVSDLYNGGNGWAYPFPDPVYVNVTLVAPSDNFNLSTNDNMSTFNATWQGGGCDNLTLYFNNTVNYTQNCSTNMSVNVSFDIPGDWSWDVYGCYEYNCNWSWNGNWSVFMDNISGPLANYSTWVNITLSAPSDNYNLSQNNNWTVFEAYWTNLICTNMTLELNGSANYTQDCDSNMSVNVSFDTPGDWSWDVRACKDDVCNYSWNGNWSVFMDNISGPIANYSQSVANYTPYDDLLDMKIFEAALDSYDLALGGNGLIYLVIYLGIILAVAVSTESPLSTAVVTIFGALLFGSLMPGAHQKIFYGIAVFGLAITIFKVFIYKRGSRI